MNAVKLIVDISFSWPGLVSLQPDHKEQIVYRFSFDVPNAITNYFSPQPQNKEDILLTFAPPALSPELFKKSLPPQEPELLAVVREALQKNVPELCAEGVGGTYFIRGSDNQKLAVFKPVDEEPGATNDPKKKLKQPLLPPGGGATRELAAYLLDKGFAGVPFTCMVSDLQHESFTGVKKSGSLQQFIANDGESSSMGSSRFLVDDVHRIGVLDLRLFNMDRNGENMLVKKEGSVYRLIPIDHTYILPETLNNAYFDWQYWRQASQPFSDEILTHIANINEEEDSSILRDLGISEKSIETMKISTKLLKRCAANRLTLAQIASIVCSKGSSELSDLERIVEQAGKSDNFNAAFDDLVNEHANQLNKKL